MKVRKTAIYILTALLLMGVFFGMAQEDREGTSFFFESGNEELRPWENEDGDYLVFLPSYVNLDGLGIRTRDPISLGEALLSDGMTCEKLMLDTPYALENGRTVTFLRSKNLPAMYINTASGSMDYIHEDKEHREAGTLRLYTADGVLDSRGSLEAMGGHGNSTFIGSPKKPYNLQFTAPADLLQMGAAEKWVLLANCYDLSHMKNKLVFDYARALGLPYTPDSQWVDLYLNGEYAGIYLLAERNEVHENRVALRDSQGFLVSKDKLDRMELQNIPFFLTEGGVPLRLHHNTMSQAQMQDILQSADSAILSPDGVDPRTGKHWSELIDLDSWARKYLIEEIFGGGDAGHYSQYFYYEGNAEGGKIYAGPVWDYDITMGIDVRQEIVPNIFYAHREHMSPWFHALYQDAAFYRQVETLYREEFYPRLQILLEETIPEYEAFLAGAARLNSLRWGGDAHEETARMQEYMDGRMEFLADVWIEGEIYSEVNVVPVGSVRTYSLVYAIVNGDSLPEFDSWQEWEWYVAGLDEKFDLNQPIYQDMEVYARDPNALPGDESAPGPESRINWELWIPTVSITVLFLTVFALDIFRTARRDLKQYDRAKTR